MNPPLDHHEHARRLNYLQSRCEALREHAAELETRLAERARRPLVARLFSAKPAGPDEAGLRRELAESAAALSGAQTEYEAAERALHAALHDRLVAEDAPYHATVSLRHVYAEIADGTSDWAAAIAGLRDADARVRRGVSGLATNHGVDLPDELRGALQAWHGACAPAATVEVKLRANLTRFRRLAAGSAFADLYLPGFATVFSEFHAGPGSAGEKLALYEKISPAAAQALQGVADAKARFASGLAEFESTMETYRRRVHDAALGGGG